MAVNKNAKVLDIKRGDIWRVSPYVKDQGSAGYQRPRPYVVCQPEKFCGAPVLMIAPLSSKDRGDYPFLQRIELDTTSFIHYNLLGAVERTKFISKIGELTPEQMLEMDAKMAVPLGIARSSILNIEGVDVCNVRFSEGTTEQIFDVQVYMAHYISYLSFTKSEFVAYFGEKNAHLLNGSLYALSGFLESLKGMKFLYTLKEKDPVRRRD